MSRFTVLYIFYISFFLLCSHVIKAQKVSQFFDVIVVTESFDSSATGSLWPTLNNADNLFVIDKGSYFLYRRATAASYVIVPKWSNELPSFYIKTSLKLAPSETNEQTIGILCMGQKDGKSAIVFEINKSKQYRVKQFAGDYIKYLTGEKETSGWIKNTAVKAADEYNTLEIKASHGDYDIYANGTYLTSFSVPEYKYGSMGIVIGPATKAKCDYFYVFTNKEILTQSIETSEVNTKLKAVITELTEENTKLKTELQYHKDLIKEKEDLEKQLIELKTENENLQTQNKFLMDTLNKISTDYDQLLQQKGGNKSKTPAKTIGQSTPGTTNSNTNKQPVEAPKTVNNSTLIVNSESSDKKQIGQPIPVKVKKAIKKS